MENLLCFVNRDAKLIAAKTATRSGGYSFLDRRLCEVGIE